MKLFDVYPLYNINIVKGDGCKVWDENGTEYLDLYGGHAVISIGHAHPHYTAMISNQVAKLGFYSNSVINKLQQEVAERLGKISGYEDYSLFLINSGAEANENALKLASFITDRSKILAMRAAFHGRTSVAVAVTDNPAIQAPLNRCHEVTFIGLNDRKALESELETGAYAAVIVEGIQGVGGIQMPDTGFLQSMRELCTSTGTLMIVDEVQSGYGRTGKFFAHQHAGVLPDIITMAKGMGNGFPIGGLLISPKIKARKGMLGTTFGGNHLACAAALAVLEVIQQEYLVNNAAGLGKYLIQELKNMPGVKEVRGKGLMIGVDVKISQEEVRKRLISEHRIMTGYSGNYTLRLLPPLIITRKEVDEFLKAFRQTMDNRAEADEQKQAQYAESYRKDVNNLKDRVKNSEKSVN